MKIIFLNRNCIEYCIQSNQIVDLLDKKHLHEDRLRARTARLTADDLDVLLLILQQHFERTPKDGRARVEATGLPFRARGSRAIYRGPHFGGRVHRDLADGLVRRGISELESPPLPVRGNDWFDYGQREPFSVRRASPGAGDPRRGRRAR